MTTIVGVVKNNSIAIAADSLTSEGELAIPGDMKLASPKIVRLESSGLPLASHRMKLTSP
jgi:ATP-dependent protease HslVU (ClpYQ) peptidase subunit